MYESYIESQLPVMWSNCTYAASHCDALFGPPESPYIPIPPYLFGLDIRTPHRVACRAGDGVRSKGDDLSLMPESPRRKEKNKDPRMIAM